MKKIRYLFCAYVPHWTAGGCMVMHLFAKMLSDMGEDVYMTLAHDVRNRENYTAVLPGSGNNAKEITSYEEAMALAQEDDVAVIYPEIVSGNPMNAKKVIRWVLYYPGGHGAGDMVYDSSELIFTYFDRYLKGTSHENSPLLTIVETRLNQFFSMEGIAREYDCILIKKGAANFETLKERYLNPNYQLLDKPIFILDGLLDKLNDVAQLNGIFNQVRNFISFDQATYYNIMASLSGCTSIVLPINDMSREQWTKEMPLYQHGVAYGFDDIERANDTKFQLVASLRETEKENFVHANKFIEMVNSRWN